MLTIKIPAIEQYDEATNMFVESKEVILQLEHSLVSLSKWESKWHKPFLTRGEKSIEETIDYIQCMTITQNVDPKVYPLISTENVRKVIDYIEAPMTATVISSHNKSSNREIITAEIIYYWMVSHNIPFDCQKWHLNRLLTLINVCNLKNAPPKKMGKRELMSRNAALNAARRKSCNTKG